MLEKTILLNKLLSVYGGLLTDKQKDAIELHYNCDMSLAEIGLELGISRQGVRDTLSRAEHTLIECEDKLGVCKKLDKVLTELKRIQSKLDQSTKEEIGKVIKDLED